MTDKMTPLEIMQKLISFPTVSSESNLPLVEWVEEYLGSHGIVSHCYTDPDQPKAALFAHVGPQVEGAVVLSGHTDVVPVEGQAWDSDPFTVIERDGKYFGRGTCDMKGFDALAIWALVEAQTVGVNRPLQLALSYDEEVGCTGAPPMIEAMQPILPKGSAVIVGEPSMMKAVTGHKGGYGYSTHVQGFEVHSSLVHTGVSAIMQAAKLIDWTNTTNAENWAKEPDAISGMFEPPWTTLHVGVIEGGTAQNITAKDCRFSLDMRVLPTENAASWRDAYLQRVRDVESEMQAIHPDTKIVVEQIFDVPGLKPEENGEAESLARSITGDNGSHVVSYGTEAGQFQQAGYSAVVCGPGDIAQAHQPNEYVTVAQFNAGHDFMKTLVQGLAG
ncbi:acetylornithine deacetylase [Parasedimentitalea maritima]|uniref:Acetylornithine deacetylase n=1 Tax=Parasedimentitalea maritima TaxID=2578117 RepID=A0ABY2UY15_9RHOB|nr:acetylornithine deacetylase [Zongyanglinia marina]TLP67766.1 acetylornithine deacetylase [Zongyanglinia marina]